MENATLRNVKFEYRRNVSRSVSYINLNGASSAVVNSRVKKQKRKINRLCEKMWSG